MKDYDHVVIWLDYFNKNLKKSKGRKQDIKNCIFDPSLKELSDATTAAGFKIVEYNDKVRYPKRSYVRSGYITLEKTIPKTKILDKISEKLVSKRTKQKK